MFLTVAPGEVHLVVTCAINQALIFRYARCTMDMRLLNTDSWQLWLRSIDENDLKSYCYLKHLAQYDSTLCSHAMDIDGDGWNEILIGTYGREMLIYKGTVWYFILSYCAHC
jgi:hypothetical protein